jgi:hypothetical protein
MVREGFISFDHWFFYAIFVPAPRIIQNILKTGAIIGA